MTTDRDAPAALGRPRGRRRRLPDTARGLVELAFGGIREQPSADGRARRPSCPSLDDALLDGLRTVVGAEHVLTDDATRALRTRGKSTPDLLRARAGDLDRRARRRRTPGRPRRGRGARGRGASSTASRSCPSAAARRSPVGWSPAREGYAGVVSLDLVRLDAPGRRRRRVDDRHPRARPARPRGRGAARRARADARATTRSRSSTPRSAASRPPAPAASPAPATAASTRSSSASPS